MNLLQKHHKLYCSKASLLVSQILRQKKQNAFNSLKHKFLMNNISKFRSFHKTERPHKIYQYFIPFQSMVYVSYNYHTQRLINLINKTRFFFFSWLDSPSGSRSSKFWGLEIKLRHNTLGRTLDERPARRRDLYLTTHNSHKRKTSMLPAGFKPANLSKRAAADPRFRPRDDQDRPMRNYCVKTGDVHIDSPLLYKVNYCHSLLCVHSTR